MDIPEHRPEMGGQIWAQRYPPPQSMCSKKPEGVDSWEWWKRITQYNTQLGMDQYLLMWDEHPFTRYFDVHQGYKVLTHCQLIPRLIFSHKCSFPRRGSSQLIPSELHKFPGLDLFASAGAGYGRMAQRCSGPEKSWVFYRFLPKPIPAHKHLLDHCSKQKLAYFDFQISQRVPNFQDFVSFAASFFQAEAATKFLGFNPAMVQTEAMTC